MTYHRRRQGLGTGLPPISFAANVVGNAAATTVSNVAIDVGRRVVVATVGGVVGLTLTGIALVWWLRSRRRRS